MDWFRFWIACFAWVFARWGRGQTLLNLTSPIVLTVFGWLSVAIGVGAAFAQSNPIWIATIAPFAFIALFVAPYKLSEDQKKRAVKAEDALTPRFSVVGDVVEGQYDKTAVIRVANLATGGAHIRNCSGYLQSVLTEVDGRLVKDTTKPPVYLQWSARHGGIGKLHLTFGHEAELDVAVISSTSNGKFLLLAFDDRLRHQYLLDERPYYMFEIVVSAENCPKVTCRLKLTLDPLGLRSTVDSYGGNVPGELPTVTFGVVDQS